MVPSKLVVSYEYLFGKNSEAGQLSQVELGADNELQYNNVINTSTGEVVLYDDTFASPCALITEDMFNADATDPNVYHLETDNYLYEPILRRLAHYIYGEPNDYIVEALSLIVEDGHIVSYEGNFAPYDYTGFVYTSKIKFYGDVVATGASVLEAPKPIEGTEIIELKTALDSLKEYNFTVASEEISTSWLGDKTSTYRQAYSGGGEHIHQLNYIGDIANNRTSDQYLYTQLSEEDSWAPCGIAYDVQIATNIKGTWYAFGSPLDGARLTADLLPSFDISTVLFEVGTTEGTYVLKDDLPDYFAGLNSSLFSLFTTNEAGTLTIDINNNQVAFDLVAASGSYGNDEKTVYSAIGSTHVSNNTVVTDDTNLKSWEDYFVTQEVVNEVLAILPNNVLNYVPVPKLPDGGYDGNLTSVGVYTDKDSNTVQLQIRLDEYGDNADAQYEDLLVLFSA